MTQHHPAHWRFMTPADLPEVLRVSQAVHPAYPEDFAVFAERQRLYPAGCLVLAEGTALHGYALSHPWLFGQPPSLNTLLHALPQPADTYYLHDVALAESARGGGFGGQVVARLIAAAGASGAGNLSLVAVNGTVPFWQRQGFAIVEDEAIRARVLSYDDAASFMARPLRAAGAGR
jgi:GNAT superfamily N-acetyltransferase